jgi:transposase
MVFSECSTDAMNIYLDLISQGIGALNHALLIMDQAGWHSNSNSLNVPDNITILDLPPYRPKLNPVERLWLWLKENYLTNTVIPKEENLIDL